MDIQNIPIADIIPQRQPFIMVDGVEVYGNSYIVTEYKVEDNNVFVDDYCMSAEGIIENMAQSSAALMGIERLETNASGKHPIGVICKIRNCTIERRPRIHEILTTNVHFLGRFSNMYKVGVYIMVSEDRIAEGEFTLAVLND